MTDWETFVPLPEPDPPDFGRLPRDTRDIFESRLGRLPIGRIHTRIGVEAIMLNENRALDRFRRDYALGWEDYAPLGTWHMRATHDRISTARPDVLPARLPSGFYSQVRETTRSEQLRHRLRRWPPWRWLASFLNGAST